MSFFTEVLVGGLLAGVMYSLVAIGFVLIFKASGVFNFSQGALVLFGALTFVSLVERQINPWLAFALTLVALSFVALAIGQWVLKPLVNRPPIVLFMATLGLSLILEGAAQLLWGSQVHGLDLGIDDRPLAIGGVMISQFDLFAAGTAALLVIGLSALMRFTRFGLSLRAIADDPVAALAVGIRLPHMWAAVWALAGLTSLVAGLVWGARLGVQFSLSLVVLKALPVLIIGGFSSIGGAIVAGLLVGATEKLAEVYAGTAIGGGIENWFPYVLAMLFLLMRPSGLFGETPIERV
ncbi:branched-chain amino acid ABC transporter permease [Trinickia sp.]|uniref:branched-chain amino acid ABC transporter permease n=1 Tax=Trinickia sp. TaxID=2571163 RepID=UPI003F81DAA9